MLQDQMPPTCFHEEAARNRGDKKNLTTTNKKIRIYTILYENYFIQDTIDNTVN